MYVGEVINKEGSRVEVYKEFPDCFKVDSEQTVLSISSIRTDTVKGNHLSVSPSSDSI